MIGDALANAAQGLVGTKFRLHGRTPESGLDCVGLCLEALARVGRRMEIPASYGLRNRTVAHLLEHAAQAGLALQDGAIFPGDVLLTSPDPLHFHLLIAAPGHHFIHAHAGLRRVVSMPGPLPHPPVRHWRLVSAA